MTENEEQLQAELEDIKYRIRGFADDCEAFGLPGVRLGLLLIVGRDG